MIAHAFVVQQHIRIHRDVTPVASALLGKGANDEAAKASVDYAEGNTVKLCGLVQILSVNRTNICP